jgi:hypothetical protein
MLGSVSAVQVRAIFNDECSFGSTALVEMDTAEAPSTQKSG